MEKYSRHINIKHHLIYEVYVDALRGLKRSRSAYAGKIMIYVV